MHQDHTVHNPYHTELATQLFTGRLICQYAATELLNKQSVTGTPEHTAITEVIPRQCYQSAVIQSVSPHNVRYYVN